MTEYRTNVLLGKLSLLYGSPSKDAAEAQAIISEYARLMNKYSDAELDAAADNIIKTRKFKSWPTIGDCIAALEDYRAKMHEENAPERKKEIPYPEWSKERIAEADRMIRCEMGETAAREGWVLGLHDFCRNHRRLPKPNEIAKLMDGARYADLCAAGVVDMGLLHEPLQKMAHSFLAKRERHARNVLGDAA